MAKWILRLCEKIARHWKHQVVPQEFIPTLQCQLAECQQYGSRTLGKLLETISERDQFKARVQELENIPPIVSRDFVFAAKGYARFMDNCAISPEEKRRACLARLTEHFQGLAISKSDLALALELGLKELKEEQCRKPL